MDRCVIEKVIEHRGDCVVYCAYPHHFADASTLNVVDIPARYVPRVVS
jgi:hypothetical protein